MTLFYLDTYLARSQLVSHISLNNLLCYHPSTMCMIQEFYGTTTRFAPALNKCALMHGTGSPRAKLTSQPSSQHSVGLACVCQGPHGSTSCQNAIGFRRSCVARQTIKHRCKVLPAGPITACRSLKQLFNRVWRARHRPYMSTV
jgi:hypothetical protein